ncbi:MAG: hypothetical protein IIB00_03675 [candidate division Zixibacteria bacterium]|nr:hypothetical protein [candidate division Zixibacteria bacterium]
MNGFIPVRSSVNPRIDENNPSKGMTTLANFDMTTFVNFLERKQYGSMSMTERMFKRRGFFENQFGRHHNMGFWSYFEEQYSPGRVVFIPFFLLGALGVYFTMRKRLDVGYPFLVLLLVSSVGLILYMNFADGMKYDVATGDAYLEVRNRDYFFTSAFVFFGLAIGLGVSALMELIRTSVSKESQAGAVKSSMAFGLLALVPFQSNYFVSDRSGNYIPYDYAHNILESCPENAILFTSGDNDTFPLWCVQEVHRLRRDVRVVNLSLLNTDWYVAQMKNRFGVPMDLSDSQIVIEFYKSGGRTIARPPLAFNDRARRRQAYLVAQPFDGGVLRVQDMMVDEIVLASKFITPVAFTSEPYAESPLGLRKLKETHGVVHELKRSPLKRQIDVDHSYDLFMNKFQFRGLNQTSIWRDDNSTGVMISVGFGGLKVFNEYVGLILIARQINSMESLKSTPGWDDNMQAKLDTLNQDMNDHNPADTAIFGERAMNITDRMIDAYPEFWMSYIVAAEYLRKEGDSATAMDYLFKGEKTLQDFLDSSPENVNYRQDLGLLKHEIVRVIGDADDQNREEAALEMIWDGFKSNPNSGMAYQKLLQYLYERRRNAELVEATRMHAKYKVNLSNANVKQILGQFPELNQ